MTRFDRRALFASGAAAALLAASGVAAAPQRGGKLRVALSPGLFDQAMAASVYDNLTEIAADGTLRGALATEWQSNPAATRWVFQLRADVQFHDGTPFTAAALTDLPGRVRRLSDLEVEITLDAADASLPYRLARPGFEVRGPDGAGTGLYAVHKFDPQRHFIGTRVATHWKTDAGWFDSIDFVPFRAAAVRAQALAERLVDVADITTLGPEADTSAFQVLPGRGATSHMAHQSVGVPLTVGKAWPLDNLRMAERWWLA